MSFADAFYLNQVEEIAIQAIDLPDTQPVLIGPKRMIIRCPNERVANRLVMRLYQAGYCSAVQPGRLSTLFYVRTYFKNTI